MGTGLEQPLPPTWPRAPRSLERRPGRSVRLVRVQVFRASAFFRHLLQAQRSQNWAAFSPRATDLWPLHCVTETGSPIPGAQQGAHGVPASLPPAHHRQAQPHSALCSSLGAAGRGSWRSPGHRAWCRTTGVRSPRDPQRRPCPRPSPRVCDGRERSARPGPPRPAGVDSQGWLKSPLSVSGVTFVSPI